MSNHYQELYQQGYIDGFNETDEYDAAASYGSNEEQQAYTKGVTDGESDRLAGLDPQYEVVYVSDRITTAEQFDAAWDAFFGLPR